MKMQVVVLLGSSIWLAGCSMTDVSEMAYGSMKGRECMDKRGEISCDLSSQGPVSGGSIVSPGENTNEALEEKARIIREAHE